MPVLLHDDLRLHYEVHGEGHPVVLLHGGVSSFEHNYAQFGWVEALTGAGLQVIGLDFRGHGQSERPHDPARYGTARLAADVVALLDHLQLATVSLVAYSIGTAIALDLMQRLPQQLDKVALVATGDGLIGEGQYAFDDVLPQMAAVFERTEYPRDLPKHQSAYWKILEQIRGDRAAMHALATAKYPSITATAAAAIRVPTLVVSGERDRVFGRGARLAAALGQGSYLEIPEANHFALAMEASVRDAVARFLGDVRAE